MNLDPRNCIAKPFITWMPIVASKLKIMSSDNIALCKSKTLKDTSLTNWQLKNLAIEDDMPLSVIDRV